MICRHCRARIYSRPGGTGRYRWSTRQDGTDTLGSGSECPANERGHEPELCSCGAPMHTPNADHTNPRPMDKEDYR